MIAQKHSTQQGRRNKGDTGARAPPQYFEQPVPVPPQYFQKILGPTNRVPLQYLTPSYAPALQGPADKEAAVISPFDT